MQVMEMEHDPNRVLAGISRSRLVAALREADGPLDIRELADAVGLHPNTTREHLERLVAAGLVERETMRPVGRGRPAFRYRAARQLDEAAAYRALASVLATALAHRPDAGSSAAAAGEVWGQTVARSRGASRMPGEPVTDDPIDKLVEVLDDAGFAPQRGGQRGEIELHRCPFGELADDQGDVICGVHLGLIRGALRELGGPLDAISLEPFVGPDLCVARVGGIEP